MGYLFTAFDFFLGWQSGALIHVQKYFIYKLNPSPSPCKDGQKVEMFH